jgi:redox-sensitive bicupin YhaK (pirin superfamily)
MSNNAIISTKPLGFTWECKDPFLFSVHHLDNYPRGNDQMGPEASLSGRNLGQDFTLKDGWRMYHGDKVPGFPMHPHRGFETVTVVLKGAVDHSDSHGASGRYGNGDVQWMTAGSGLQHAEMFPLVNKEKENPLHLFQIWLNLPKAKKFVEPHYKMLWAEDIPKLKINDDQGKSTEITIIAGKIGETAAPQPAPDSWAAESDNDVAIWIIKMTEGGKWILPPTSQPMNRILYFYEGSSIKLSGSDISSNLSIELQSDHEVEIENGEDEAQFLMLQGRPIGEPVVQYGPFVMNSQTEIHQAFSDYRETQFGGWPWDRTDPVHSEAKGKFAKYANGKEEKKNSLSGS